MSIKRNLDETLIVNYICKSNRQFLYAVRKNRIQRTKEPIMALCKLQSNFLRRDCLIVSNGEKTQGFLCQTRNGEAASRRRTRVRRGSGAKP